MLNIIERTGEDDHQPTNEQATRGNESEWTPGEVIFGFRVPT